MKVFLFCDLLSAFHEYVLRENTGNARVFAEKLNISRATLYNLIDDLKDYNIIVKYSRFRATFYYESPDNVEINISIKLIDNHELKNINGGQLYFCLSMNLDKQIINLH